MKRVLVTGASGFVGGHTLSPLQALGYEVHAIGRTPVEHPDVVFHSADLMAAEQRQAILAEVLPTHLLHLAWYAEPGLYWHSPRNLDWVSTSLALAREFTEVGGKRIVVAGTCAEYEWGSAQLEERTTPCRPSTLYGSAKDGLRRILESYAKSTELSFAWGRLFYLYGPGERRGRLVSDTIAALHGGETVPASHGRQRRDFMHVADVGGAFAALLDTDVQGAVNIGSGHAVAVRDLIVKLIAIIDGGGKVEFGARPLSPSEPDVIEADARRLAEQVGFLPKFDLQNGLENTVRSTLPTLPQRVSNARGL